MSLVETIETRLKVFDEAFQRQHATLDTVEATIAKVTILCQQFEAEWRAAKETIKIEFAAEADALLGELAQTEMPIEGEPEPKDLEPPEPSLSDNGAPCEGETLSLPQVNSELEHSIETRDDAAPSQPINDDHEAEPTPPAVDEAPPVDEVRADAATSDGDEAALRAEGEALPTASTFDETPPRTVDEVQALPTPSTVDDSPPRTVDNVQAIEKQSPGASEARRDTGEQWRGASGLVPSGIFFVAFDSSESLGFSIALMRDKMRGTAHVIVDKIFDPRPSAGQLKILDELVAIGDTRVGRIASMSQFYSIVEQIRRSPRPLVLMFHRSDNRYLQANYVPDRS